MTGPRNVKELLGKILGRTAEVGDAIELFVFIRDAIKKDPPRTMKPRAESDVMVMSAICRIAVSNQEASTRLLARHRARQNMTYRSYGEGRRYGIGEETDFMEALGKIVSAFPENPDQVDLLFGWLDKMSDEEFDAAIEMLLNDGADKLYRFVAEKIEGSVQAGVDRFSARAASAIDTMNDALVAQSERYRAERALRVADPRRNPRRRW